MADTTTPSCEDVLENYITVRDAVRTATVARNDANKTSTAVRLVAVSKTKPLELLAHLYHNAGCRVFGENYAQELSEKARELPSDIEWHFIGHLQSNKAASLVRDVPQLAVVETVDSENLAKRLNAAVEQVRPQQRLAVYIQVNTSGEASKSGVAPGEEVSHLAQYIAGNCPFLELRGAMTIGKPDYTCTLHDFETLVASRQRIADVLRCDASLLELSMGMSSDYEAAIHAGSTNVRVGSSIFGPRQRK